MNDELFTDLPETKPTRLQAARAELERAEKESDRLKALFENDIAFKDQFESALWNELIYSREVEAAEREEMERRAAK